MKLWHLVRTDKTDYDEYDAKVVRAENEAEARRIAAQSTGVEGPDPWLNTATCLELTAEGEPGEVIGSFNAG